MCVLLLSAHMVMLHSTGLLINLFVAPEYITVCARVCGFSPCRLLRGYFPAELELYAPVARTGLTH